MVNLMLNSWPLSASVCKKVSQSIVFISHFHKPCQTYLKIRNFLECLVRRSSNINCWQVCILKIECLKRLKLVFNIHHISIHLRDFFVSSISWNIADHYMFCLKLFSTFTIYQSVSAISLSQVSQQILLTTVFFLLLCLSQASQAFFIIHHKSICIVDYLVSSV